jgi:hypothetical protein
MDLLASIKHEIEAVDTPHGLSIPPVVRTRDDSLVAETAEQIHGREPFMIGRFGRRFNTCF